MKKEITINIATLITFVVLSVFAYYLLLLDNFLHLSIASIIDQSHGLEVKKHVLVLGLLPFYIAAVVFGTAMLSTYLGTIITQLYARFKNKPAPDKAESLRNAPSSL